MMRRWTPDGLAVAGKSSNWSGGRVLFWVYSGRVVRVVS